MALIVVEYHYDERTDLRMEHRPAHREFLSGLHDQGVVLLCGPWADDGPAGALLIVRADSPDHALDLLNEDPLHEVGVISTRKAREYQQVFGPFAD